MERNLGKMDCSSFRGIIDGRGLGRTEKFRSKERLKFRSKERLKFRAKERLKFRAKERLKFRANG
jgi:hypothetical protein